MSLKDKTVLIVEDEPMLRELIAYDFQDHGALVLQAADVDEALELLKANTFALILSDIKLPGKDGVFLLKTIKAQALSQAPVILITGYSDYSREDLIKLGASDVLYKPFGVINLVECAREIVSAIPEPSEA